MGKRHPVIRRRDMLMAIGAGWLGEQQIGRRPAISGKLLGASHRVGHLLRGAIETPKGLPEKAEVVIVGSGVSGASAAWRLRAAGIEAQILELEPFAGGTSAWGQDGPVPHPWGAHYLPIPDEEARVTRRLLEQLGVITGWDAANRPLFQQEMLCHTPLERLFYQGKWHADLIPFAALTKNERHEITRFRAFTRALSLARGSDGRFAFAIPIETSSRDPNYLGLSRSSMYTWLKTEGYNSRFFYWYVENAMLDDFGADLRNVSAWAGLHYFASRRLSTEQTKGSRYLVWPEGNGWLVRRLLKDTPRKHGALVISVRPREKGGVELLYWDVSQRALKRLHARAAILAIPAFVARRLIGSAAEKLVPRVASPWMVANLWVTRRADPNAAWDSVIFDGAGLGSVDAGHQRLGLHESTVLTYFRAYGGSDPQQIRAQMLKKNWFDFASEVLIDLTIAHPALPEQTKRIDIMLWGHAMPRPVPGFIDSVPFNAPTRLLKNVAWAHVDQSGIALFEEANLHGVRAAETIAADLGVNQGQSWL